VNVRTTGIIEPLAVTSTGGLPAAVTSATAAPSPALQGGARTRQHQVGAVGDRGKHGQQRVRSRISAVGQRDQAAAPRDEATAGQRYAPGDVHPAH
jgi:hypothetical protein